VREGSREEIEHKSFIKKIIENTKKGLQVLTAPDGKEIGFFIIHVAL
jgi:hypothetical protein